MVKHNAANERIKRQYFAYLKEAKRHSEATVDAAADAIAAFEADTHRRDFKAFRIDQAMAFKRRLMERVAERTGKQLSKATCHAILGHLKQFVLWLAGQPGFKSRIKYSDAEYFNLSDKDTRIATARRETSYPTLEHVLHVIAMMPSVSEVDRRDRALIAFMLLTAARDSAVASLKLKHVDLAAGRVYQDAREVNTKNSKTIDTFFVRVGDGVEQIVVDWVTYLRTTKLWGNDDPLFPATQVDPTSDRQFCVTGLKRAHWRTAAPIRKVFRKAFVAAGLRYYNPHTLRKTLTSVGLTWCSTPEEFKAWSQNLGHEHVMTTFTSYGAVAPSRQGEIIRDLRGPSAQRAGGDAEAIAQEVVRLLEARPKPN